MRAAQTLADQKDLVANVRDLRLPAISVERPTRCPSSLRLAGPCCAVIVSAQVEQHSREPDYQVKLKSKLTRRSLRKRNRDYEYAWMRALYVRELREMQRIAEREGKVEAFFDEPLRLLNECILLIHRTPLPFIAAVNGAASGGGCNLALACDLVVAGESARFNQAFIKIGLVPDCGGTFILPRLVGWKRATELMMTGEVMTASRALEMGMINAVVPDEELLARALAMAEQLAHAPTAAIGRTKELLEASATNDYGGQLELERKMQIQSGLTKDFREGVAAFIEKRPPKFVGG